MKPLEIIFSLNMTVFRWLRARDKSNLLAHARRELDIIGMLNSDDEMDRKMTDCLLDIVYLFSQQGHSGFSAGYALATLKELLAFQPIAPLTGEPDEWADPAIMDFPVLQNKRCGRVFKNKDTGEAYDTEGIVFEDSEGCRYTTKGSHVPVTFPYTPTTRIVKDWEPQEAAADAHTA